MEETEKQENKELKLDQNQNEADNAFQQTEVPPREPVYITISDIELEKLKREASEYKDKYQRALAESENARKRMQKERQELIQYALQNLVADFLNPIDHLENALKFTQQASDEIKHWALGFQMILNQFKEVLNSNGVIYFPSEGTKFDPHLHEAIEMITSEDHLPGTVVSESLKGYKMGERIIRPARVKVAEAPFLEEINKDEIEQ
jgi:molecular chaperone GrpE